MDWLKELLKNAEIEDEKVDELIANINKEVPKYFIPKAKYNELSEVKKNLEQQLSTANSTIEELKKSNKDNEELQKQIKQYEEQLENLKAESEAKIRDLTLDNAIKLALKENAKYDDLLIGKVDKSKLIIKEDGTIEGLEEQIKTLKEDYKELFVEPLGGYTPNNKGGSQTNSDLVQIEKIIQQNLGF